MAPPNSLSKPLLQNRGVIRNATIEEIEAGKSLIEEDAYAQYLVAAIGLQDSTPLNTPTELNLKLHKEEGDLLSDPATYCMLVCSLVYLTITTLDISYAVQ
ncbi:uncharacterized protein LOC133694154 isoform X2 [Populus nigra]|uniref:uncharacterized protein LOC133694154 isoform X2 n=1 Tax=Populus nigra TaxID=3691 RepID=UPI002B27BC90|nr:uncharacterized protein LOC133694154 isoform X2 [Populus nigra]